MKTPKRPRDPAQLAKLMVDIATGEVEDAPAGMTEAQRFAQSGGVKGGKARAESTTPEQRSAIARKGAASRWHKDT